MFKWELINDHTGENEVLQTDPHGWEDISFEHNRSEKYDGMFLDFSRELSFHCKGGGKEMLDNVYQQYGSEGQVTLIIYFKCQGGFKKLAETFIHFPSYREEFKGKTLHTIVEVRKKGITQLVLSRDETDVDLLSEESIGGVALNPYTYAPYTINSHSKTIRLISRYDGIKSNDDNACLVLTSGIITDILNNPGITINATDLKQTNDVESTWYDNATNNEYTPRIDTTQQPYAYPLTVQITWDFSGHFYLDSTSTITRTNPDDCGSGTTPVLTNVSTTGTSRTEGVDLMLIKSSNSIIGQNSAKILDVRDAGNAWVLARIPENNYVGFISEPFSGSGGITVTLNNSSEQLFLLWYFPLTISGALASGTDINMRFEYDTAEIDFTADTNSPPTDFKAIAIHEAWSRICEGITDKPLAFKSEFFGRRNSQGLKYAQNGYAGFTAITDGLRIRGFEKADDVAVGSPLIPINTLTFGKVKKGIITNLNKHYEACNAVWGIGMGIETHEGVEVVRVEEKDYYYQDTEIYKISNIPNLEMSFSEDLAYSEVQIGYEKWKIESKGGLDEPNTIARWVFPKIKNIKNTKELTSSYVAGMYAIESTRRESLIFNTTGDSDYDDDIFFIALRRTRPDQTPTPLSLSIAEKNENIAITQDTLLAPETAYNLRFNLFSNFDRTMNQFTNNLTKDTPQQINYSYLEGNGQMEFEYNEPTWAHPGDLNGLTSQNVQNTEIPNGRHRRQYPILLPEVYTFSFPVPFSDYIQLIGNPYGYISFSETDKKHKKGYIKTLAYNLSRQMAEFTLIRKYD